MTVDRSKTISQLADFSLLLLCLLDYINYQRIEDNLAIVRQRYVPFFAFSCLCCP